MVKSVDKVKHYFFLAVPIFGNIQKKCELCDVAGRYPGKTDGCVFISSCLVLITGWCFEIITRRQEPYKILRLFFSRSWLFYTFGALSSVNHSFNSKSRNESVCSYYRPNPPQDVSSNEIKGTFEVDDFVLSHSKTLS